MTKLPTLASLPDLTLDGNTILPPVFTLFSVLIFLLSHRLMTLRLYPYQRTTDLAYFFVTSLDLISWLLIHIGFNGNHDMQATISTFLSPAGPAYPLLVFMPQQVLFLLSLCFRRALPFHACVYASFLVTGLSLILTKFNYVDAVNERFLVPSKNPTPVTGTLLEGYVPSKVMTECEDQGMMAQFLLAWSGVIILTAAFRSSKDRLNLLLLMYAFIGLANWASCAKNKVSTGWAIVLGELVSYLLIKLERVSLDVGSGFVKPKDRNSDIEVQQASYYKKMTRKDIKKVAIVIDGFIGPRAVICGISRSYEAWIIEMVRQGVSVVVYSAFPKEEIEQYFQQKVSAEVFSKASSNPSETNVPENDAKVIAYQLDTLDIKYVSQVYYATRASWKNVKLVSQTFHDEKIDVVHVVFDGSSVPIFAWACAWLRIPVVGIMHTDTIVICERNGFKTLSPFILQCQKMCGSSLDSIATRSKSFADEMLRLRNWKCDHVIKPHVKTEIFKPNKSQIVLDIRKKLTWAKDDENVTYDEKTKSFNDGKLLLIYAGRFDIDKRVDELFQLMKTLSKPEYDGKYDNIYLAMIGGGSLGEDVFQLHGPKNRVYCHPSFLSHEDLALYYNAADIHISASQMETLGNTVLESLACGTPVLVPKAQGFVDTVTDNETGLLWDPNSDIDAFIKLAMLHDNPALLKKLKDGAKASIEGLHCSSAVKDLLDWYVQAGEARRLKTLAAPRIFLATFVLFGFFWFDIIILDRAKRILEGFADKKVREENRQQHLKTA